MRLVMRGPNGRPFPGADLRRLADAIESTTRPEPYGTQAKTVAAELRTMAQQVK